MGKVLVRLTAGGKRMYVVLTSDGIDAQGKTPVLPSTGMNIMSEIEHYEILVIGSGEDGQAPDRHCPSWSPHRLLCERK